VKLSRGRLDHRFDVGSVLFLRRMHGKSAYFHVEINSPESAIYLPGRFIFHRNPLACLHRLDSDPPQRPAIDPPSAVVM
jgi:hypothetical protein